MGLQFYFVNFGQFGVFFFEISSLGVLRFDLVDVLSFLFCFFFKFGSFQLFSSHFGGLHFILFTRGWGFRISFWPSFCLPCDGCSHWFLIVIFVFKKKSFSELWGNFCFFKV
jgi:hypothetical protein